MAQLALHHVNLIVTDLPRSLAFYQNLFGLRIIEQPPFKRAGAWLACGAPQGEPGGSVAADHWKRTSILRRATELPAESQGLSRSCAPQRASQRVDAGWMKAR